MIHDLLMFFRYLHGLKDYVRQPRTPVHSREYLQAQLLNRRESFLHILRRGIFTAPKNPYRRLLQHARIEYEDIVRLVEDVGVEGALSRLYDAGVYVTLDEFKGRRPIQRAGLQMAVHSRDFDNPLLSRDYKASTGGSRGGGSPVTIDFDLIRHEAAYMIPYMAAFGTSDRPVALWLGVPPVAPGIKNILRYAGMGKRVERWFASSKSTWKGEGWKFALFTAATIYCGRLFGAPFPAPMHVPAESVIEIVRWLAKKRAEGRPAVLDTFASAAVRVCIAALDRGLDIRDTYFRCGGEPLTDAKSKIVSSAGCRVTTHYAMAEIGVIGMACARPAAPDDVHLVTDKLAVIQRPKTVGTGGTTVPTLVYTTLLSCCPKLMLNVESDDYAVLEKRRCGCPFEDLGFDHHLSHIRSYEKLTSEGVTFLGTELLRMIDDFLPETFGGHSTHYQLVEQETDGLSRVNLVVHPTVGDIDENALLEAVFKFLRQYPGGEAMADDWKRNQTLKVVRRVPYLTSSAKILPIHILENR